MTASSFTATVEPKGSKFVHRVFDDGKQVDQRVSEHRYLFAIIQRWSPVGVSRVTANGAKDLGDRNSYAVRYSAKPKPHGGKVGYGYCERSVAIEEIAPAAKAAPKPKAAPKKATKKAAAPVAPTTRNAERDAQIDNDHANGATVAVLATRYALSPRRIHRILQHAR